VISDAENITLNIQIEALCILRDVWYSPTTPVNLLSVRCIKTHGNYVTTKDGYQIVNRKSGKVVMKGVSIGKMYALKQSIPNILYKNITEDIEQEKAFIEKVGQMFHTDVCSPISIPIINSNRWLCIVVDNVSRLLFLFFMKDKDDAATYIKEYVKMVNT
jgi:hypothetical protein